MSEIKQRKKPNLSAKPEEHQQTLDKQSSLGSAHGPRSFWMDARTAASCLSLMACVGLTWFLFQQSAQLAAIEENYHLLKQDAVKFHDMDNKIKLISTKLEPPLDALWESSSSISAVTKLEQEVASLRNFMPDIHNSKQTLSKKVQNMNEKFQSTIGSWKRSLDEMETNTSSLNSEARHLHNKLTIQINAADSRIKSLSERLKDLEDSTIRNVKTLKRQEDVDLSKIEWRLQDDSASAKEVEEKQNNLLARNDVLSQKLADHKPKVEECKAHLPVIESAIHTVVRLSSDLMDIEKVVEDIAVKVFHVEGEMVKATFEIMNIQKALESIQHKNHRSKQQKEVLVLKVHDFTEPSEEIKEHYLENHQ